MSDGITVERKDNRVNIILDMSMWDLFETCKARYNYRHNQNRSVPISHKAPSLDMGGLAHEGLDVYFTKLKEGMQYNDRMQAALVKMRAISSDPDQCNLEPEESSLVMRAVEESCDYWRFEDEMQEILEVERAFAYVLYEEEHIRIIISGKIDLLVNKPGIGQNASYKSLPRDHKTYSKDFEVPELSNQFMNYCVATGSQYLEVNRIGLHNPDAKKPKPPEEKFYRPIISYDLGQLETFKRNLTKGIIHEYLDCLGRDEWRMNFTSCFKFNRKCEFYEVCKTSDEAKRAELLDGSFILASPWDVTAKLKKS